MSRNQTTQNRSEEPPLGTEHRQLHEWLQQVRFKKQLFGGVSEADVWKKIAELNRLYEAALAAERIRYDTLLQEYAADSGLREKARDG